MSEEQNKGVDPEKVIKFFNTIDGNVSGMKHLTLVAAGMAVLLIVIALILAYRYAASASGQVYVIDQGRSVMALRTDETMTANQEAEQHLMMFHHYFFNLAPNRKSIDQNMELAYMLCDGSAKEYYDDLNEDNYYNRLIANNIVQHLIVDSVFVNTNEYPFKAVTYATMELQRSTKVSTYSLVTTCRIVRVPRSPGNLNGMMMENFAVVKQELLGTEAR